MREGKRGAIPQDLAPILERLQIDGEGWFQLIGQFRRLFRRAAQGDRTRCSVASATAAPCSSDLEPHVTPRRNHDPGHTLLSVI